MNTTLLRDKNVPNRFEIGDIFQNPHDKELFILARYHEEYLAICLSDGRWLEYGSEKAEDAVRGLVFVGRGMHIEVSKQ